MGHLLVVAKQTLYNQAVRNTFWFGGNDAVMANAQAICDGVRLAWAANLASALANDWSLSAFDVYDKTIPSVPAVEILPTLGTLVGSSASEPLPTTVALLCSFKAQVAPPNRNRKYLAGFWNGQVVSGYFTTATSDAVQDWADDILALGTSLSLAIVMEVVALDVDGTVTGGNPLTSATPRRIPATQRRRRIGVGI